MEADQPGVKSENKTQKMARLKMDKLVICAI